MSRYIGGEIPLIILGIVMAVPTAIWLRYRIEFLKYPKFVRWEYFLRKRKMSWLIIFENILLLGVFIAVIYVLVTLIFLFYS